MGDFSVLTGIPALAQAVEKAYPRIQLVAVEAPLSPPPAGVTCILNTAAPDSFSGNSYSYLPMGQYLKYENLDPSVFQTGLLASLTSGDSLMAVPYAQFPLAVRWRPDVFSAARLSPPSAAWTWQDLESICVEIEAAIKAKVVPGLLGVFPPLLAFYDIASLPIGASAAADPQIWMAFVLGYGGSIVSNGVYKFDASALSGLSAYVGLLNRFAPPPAIPAGKPGAVPAPRRGFALSIESWSHGASTQPLTPPWSYARLPRFATNPLITTGPLGVGVTPAKGKPATAAGLDGAATALTWLSTPTAVDLLMAHQFPPVVGAADVHQAFWARIDASDRVVGDWQHFVPWSAGWLAVPPGAYMEQAIATAAADPTKLQAALKNAEQQMNAWLQGQV